MSSDKTDPALRQFFTSLSEEFEEEDTDRSNRDLTPEGQRPCPICREYMTSTHETGVLIDVCEAHGMWLDKDELRAIVKRSQQSELAEALKARAAAEKEAHNQNGDFLLGFVIGSGIS